MKKKSREINSSPRVNEIIKGINIGIILVMLMVYNNIKDFIIIGNEGEDSILMNISINKNKITMMIMIAISVFIVLNYYLPRDTQGGWEGKIMIIMGLIGAIVILTSNNWIRTYIGLEIYAITMYIIILLPSQLTTGIPNESQVKTSIKMVYIIIGGISSIIIIYGITEIYRETGLLNMTSESEVGGKYIITGILIKIGSGPYNIWVPELYDKVSRIVLTYITIISKIVYSGLIYEILSNSKYDPSNLWFVFNEILGIKKYIIIVGIISMIIGSIGAIKEMNIKKIIAYSSIYNIGLILSALIIGLRREIGIEMIEYIWIYVFNMLIILGINMLRRKELRMIPQLLTVREANPVIAIIIGLWVFTMIGIPPLSGFYGKIRIIFGSIQTTNILLWLIALIIIISTLISANNYLRISQQLYFYPTNLSGTKKKEKRVFIEQVKVNKIRIRPNGISSIISISLLILFFYSFLIDYLFIFL